MTFRKVRFFVVAFALSTLLLGAGAARPAGTAAAPPAQSNWVFEGCWTQWPSGPCRDVYRDAQGNYWICRACGTTGSPGTGNCTRIGSSTLATGWWCS